MTAPSCDCPPSTGPSRRRLLQGLGIAAGAAALSPALSIRASYAEGYTGDVLVVVSLRGGMDGMSLVAPVGDPDYVRLRPTIAVPTSTGVPTGDRMFALHPSLSPLKALWDAGVVGAVHAVGTPDTTRSHFAATEELERAAPGTTLRTGWLDRVLATRATGTTFQAVQLGSGTPATMFAGSVPELAAIGLPEFKLASSDWVGPRMATAIGVLQNGLDGSPQVPAARTTLAALDASAAVVLADPGPHNGAVYPKTPLGAGLADVARLVRAGRGLQAASVDEGDWDMHSALGAAGGGDFAAKAADLGQSLAAFATDLGPLLNGVSVVTLSEFGRRARENGSGGTDHGHGNAVLLMGGGIVGGKVHGAWPGLSDAALDDGMDLAGTTDYRSIIGELVVKRTGVPVAELTNVFPGWTPSFVGLTRPV